MKTNEDDDLEFMDLEDDEYDSREEAEDAYDDDETFDDELDERTLRFVHRVLFPSVIGLVAVIVVVAAVILLKDTKKAEKVNASVAEDISGDVEPEHGGQDIDSVGMQEPILEAAPSDSKAGETAAEEDAAALQEKQDPQTETMSTEQGTEVDVSKLLSSEAAAETDEITFGIDVARYQGTVDWAQVAASGVDFAMVRVGYRINDSREIQADTNARYNMQEAQKNGIKLGVYFFSTAASEAEAVEEADWTADYIAQYQITYPVAYDCEGFEKADSAQVALTKTERTDIALAYMKRIHDRGYTPMFYAAMGELAGEAKWETSKIENLCKIWVSQYPATPYPQTEKSSYGGVHAMWQYTNRGTVPGISRPVDVNIAYFGYEGTAKAQNDETPQEVQADVEALMNFQEVSEEVTAKDATNLRDIPSQGEESKVVHTLQNGETAIRTGISDSGWSRLTYNEQTVYAVSSYLTTDLSYQAPKNETAEGAGSGDGLKTKFTERNEQVTAKIEVNLRALPSVTNPDATVVAVLHNGEYATRTGINEDYGWSRLSYNGQTVYAITSYLRESNE